MLEAPYIRAYSLSIELLLVLLALAGFAIRAAGPVGLSALELPDGCLALMERLMGRLMRWGHRVGSASALRVSRESGLQLRGTRGWSSRLTIGVVLLSSAMALHGCSQEPTDRQAEPAARRVLLIGIDGAAPRVADSLLEAGRMPNLARIASRGVHGTIRSAIPIDSPRIWNTVATGKVPDKHGINHFAHQDGQGRTSLFLSSDRRVHALWNIVSDAGMKAGVVNFWNTYPPELINGVMVSDHLLARNIEGRRKITHADEVPTGPVIHPESWHDRLLALLERAEPPTTHSNPLTDEPNLPGFLVLVGQDFPRRFDEDGALVQITREIDRELEPELMMVLLPGIDRISHFLWLGLEDPMVYEEILRMSEEERRGAANALKRYYEYTDALIGVLMEGYADDDLVIVMSDHGFEAGRGMGLLSGVHEGDSAIDGVFYASGAGIEPGSPVGELSVADVTPTILAWLGIPLGEDMDGRPGSFIPPSTADSIPTHDTAPVARMELRPSGAEEEIVEQLKSLGYLE